MWRRVPRSPENFWKVAPAPSWLLHPHALSIPLPGCSSSAAKTSAGPRSLGSGAFVSIHFTRVQRAEGHSTMANGPPARLPGAALKAWPLPSRAHSSISPGPPPTSPLRPSSVLKAERDGDVTVLCVAPCRPPCALPGQQGARLPASPRASAKKAEPLATGFLSMTVSGTEARPLPSRAGHHRLEFGWGWGPDDGPSCSPRRRRGLWRAAWQEPGPSQPVPSPFPGTAAYPMALAVVEFASPWATVNEPTGWSLLTPALNVVLLCLFLSAGH